MKELLKSGYSHSFDYSKGQLWHNASLLGWSGNTTVQDVIDKVSILKTEADCPKVWLKFINNGHQSFNQAVLQLTSMVHPSGRCCRVVAPRDINNSTLGGLLLRIDYDENNDNGGIDGIRMFLSNRQESNYFHIKSFNMLHDQLKALKSQLGYIQYDLEVHENQYLEDNRDFQCKNYKPGEYNSCLSHQYIEQQLLILNCTPPWMTTKEDLWCQHLTGLDQKKMERFDFFLSELILGRDKKGPCLPSCKSTS